MTSIMIADATTMFVLEVVPNWSLKSQDPYYEYYLTSIFIWVTYGIGWLMWLANFLFDNQGGKLQLVYLIYTHIHTGFSFILFFLWVSIYFGYGRSD